MRGIMFVLVPRAESLTLMEQLPISATTSDFFRHTMYSYSTVQHSVDIKGSRARSRLREDRYIRDFFEGIYSTAGYCLHTLPMGKRSSSIKEDSIVFVDLSFPRTEQGFHEVNRCRTVSGNAKFVMSFLISGTVCERMLSSPDSSQMVFQVGRACSGLDSRSLAF